MNQYHTLRFLLGDQLNASHSWFHQQDAGVLYLIAELPSETSYVKHHIQKLCAFFLAMEGFAKALQSAGHEVQYLTLDETQDCTINDILTSLANDIGAQKIELQRPDEYRLLTVFKAFVETSELTVSMCDTEHFLLPFDEIPQHFKEKHSVRMEHFYRKMRQRFDILMNEEGQPEGGKWNYDASNRQKLKTDDLSSIPQPLCFQHDIKGLLARLKRHHIVAIGHVGESLSWPITRREAHQLLGYFCDRLLVNFGRFQDAMTSQSEHAWSLYHSRLSFALNCKLISPMQVIQTAIASYRQNDQIDLAQIEGFVRQILGWREYVRGMYWINMPDYHHQNALQANRDLPEYFWTGETKMNCLANAIGQSLEFAYAHHIQRLMITGNFALLTGIEPKQVDEWYLGIYVDAIEWVELPNTRGMSQFADGGWVASKPYAASGRYVQKMSDYCGSCHYKVKDKTGEQACPLNSLYWRFMMKHRDWLAKNPRISMIYGNWDKQSSAQQHAVLERAEWCLTHIESL